jgi:hypothetical protein
MGRIQSLGYIILRCLRYNVFKLVLALNCFFIGLTLSLKSALGLRIKHLKIGLKLIFQAIPGRTSLVLVIDQLFNFLAGLLELSHRLR